MRIRSVLRNITATAVLEKGRIGIYVVVVVYQVTVVAIGHGLLNKFWPLVIGCVLRTAGSSIIGSKNA